MASTVIRPPGGVGGLVQRLTAADCATLTSSSSTWLSRRRLEDVVGDEETGGFDVEVVDLVDGERLRYSCPICLLLLRDPLQTSCGHRFCQRCIRRWCCETPECPTCKQHIDLQLDLFPDNCAKREVLNLTSRCPNRKEGCDVTLSLGQLQTHLRVCTAAKQLCVVCGERISKVEMDRHRTETCPSATVDCNFSSFGCSYKCERRFIGEHLSQCIEQHVLLLATHVRAHPCRCTAEHASSDVAQSPRHGPQQRTSLAEPVKLSGFDSADIFIEDTVSMSQLARSDSGLPPSYFTEQRLAEIYWALQDQRPTSAARSTSAKQINTPATYQAMSSVSPETHLNAGSASKLYPSQTGDVILSTRNQDALNNTLMEQAMKLTQYESRVARLETKLSELESDSGCRHGVYVMKIDSYTGRRLPEARSGQVPVIYSQAFYSHPQGYKFCLRVHPNGVGASDQSPAGNGGPFLSLFIHLMRGDYDDILEWPFRGRITLTVLDLRTSGSAGAAVGRASSSSSSRQQQQHRKKDISACVPETDPTLEAFQRPTSARSKRGFGYVEFAPLADLQVGSAASPFFVDDTLYIRATVEVAKSTGG